MKSDIIEAATGKFIEPKHAGLLFSKMDLVRALNHYNVFAKSENLKAWTMTYLKKHHPELISDVSKAPMTAFGTYGALCRMSERGFNFGPEDLKRIHDYFLGVQKDVLKSKAAPKVEAVKVVSTAPKYTRSREAFEMAIDETVMTGKLVMPSLIMSESHKDLADICNSILLEIEECPEGYGTASDAKLVQKFCRQVLEKVEKVKSVKKATGPTIIKNPAKQVAAVKFQRSVIYPYMLDKLKVNGIEPIDTLERKKMYVFDTKYRRLIVFVALTAAGFQYSGTTLKNVDLSKSFSKTVRKPDEFFAANKIGIAELNKAFDAINSKATPMIASRFNNDWLILRATEKGA